MSRPPSPAAAAATRLAAAPPAHGTAPPLRIAARQNPLLQRIRRLARDPGAYREAGQVWIEGEHLGRALRLRGWRAALALVADRAWAVAPLRELALEAPRVVRVDDALFDHASALPAPAGLGFLVDLDGVEAALQPGVSTVVLDRVQDPGNVGSVLRSAAAFGFGQVVALTGTAALWSPKVLRAAMGAHFALRLVEGRAPDELDALALPLIATSSHGGEPLPRAALPWPCAWVFGHEGQGVDASLLARCRHRVGIPQPGGEESLNVAAAAAVCLYESMRRRGD